MRSYYLPVRNCWFFASRTRFYRLANLLLGLLPSPVYSWDVEDARLILASAGYQVKQDKVLDLLELLWREQAIEEIALGLFKRTG